MYNGYTLWEINKNNLFKYKKYNLKEQLLEFAIDFLV